MNRSARVPVNCRVYQKIASERSSKKGGTGGSEDGKKEKINNEKNNKKNKNKRQKCFTSGRIAFVSRGAVSLLPGREEIHGLIRTLAKFTSEGVSVRV